jgi:hypothetical protein
MSAEASDPIGGGGFRFEPATRAARPWSPEGAGPPEGTVAVGRGG